MQPLIDIARHLAQQHKTLPFSVYTSVKEQHIVNVPIIKPMLICVLDGNKQLGRQNVLDCPAGSFIFLSNHPTIDMRNIPQDSEYFALLIEFDYQDFDVLPRHNTGAVNHFVGQLDATLTAALAQFVTWSDIAPAPLWAHRRQELLLLLLSLGYDQVCQVVESPTVSHKVHLLVSTQPGEELGFDAVASKLAMSESTLRRKLVAEGSSYQSIKEGARLGHGLHLFLLSVGEF